MPNLAGSLRAAITRPVKTFPLLLATGALLIMPHGLAQETKPAIGPVAAAIWIKAPLEATVPFSGMVNYDSVSAGGPMMYPAGDLASMFVAVVTHGVILGTMKDRQRQQMREQADLVLAPYQETLESYRFQELLQDTLPNIRHEGNKSLAGLPTEFAAGDLLIETTPVFYMTQDRRALIVDNAVSVALTDGSASYKTVVRVVSPPIEADEAAQFWSENNGRDLKMESARLVATSLDIALRERTAGMQENLPYKTVRYVEGGAEKMERGQLISQRCGQVVLKTLRGNLMVVPDRGTDKVVDGEPCTSAKKLSGTPVVR